MNVPIPEDTYKNSGQAGSHLIAPGYANMDADLKIYIDRNSDDCFNSCAKIFDCSDLVNWDETVVKNGERYKNNCDMIIGFDALFKTEAMKYIWETISDSPFQKDKVNALLNMNIQRNEHNYNFSPEFLEAFTGKTNGAI